MIHARAAALSPMLLCCALTTARADTTTFFNASQVAAPVASGATSETFSCNGYTFTCTRDKLFTGGTGTVIGRTLRVPWPTGVECQSVTTAPPGVPNDGKAHLTLTRTDGGTFDLTSFSFRLLANTAATGAALEIMPTVNGEDAFNDPVMFDATGYYGMTFSYGNTAPLRGFATYKVTLFTDFAFTALALTTPPPPCPADLGRQGGLPGGDGLLDNNDFVVFISDFFTGAPEADVGSQGGARGPDGALNNNDFVVFIDLFFSGC